MFCLIQHYNHAYVQANAVASLWIFHLAALVLDHATRLWSACCAVGYNNEERTNRRSDRRMRSELCFSGLTGSLGAQRVLFIYRGLECVHMSVIFIQGRYTVKSLLTELLGRTWLQCFQVLLTVQKSEQEKDQNQQYRSQVVHLSVANICLFPSLYLTEAAGHCSFHQQVHKDKHAFIYVD